MLILFLAATVIACCAAALFHAQENWSYLDPPVGSTVMEV